MSKRQRKISDQAVERATGKRWEYWFRWLDRQGARKRTHKEIAECIRPHVETGWWAQSIAVEYEYERGMRTAVGATADAGFEVGVQRTLALPRDIVWDLLTSQQGLRIWLGDAKSLHLKKGARYETADGTSGEVRSIDAGRKLRLTWHPPRLEEPSTVQISLESARNARDKTTVRFHQEKLPSAAERERMKKRWQEAVDRISALIEN